MRFEPESKHGANAGLDVARNLMEKVHEEFPWISYGDLWTLAGVAAVQVGVLELLRLDNIKDEHGIIIGNGRPQDPMEAWTY